MTTPVNSMVAAKSRRNKTMLRAGAGAALALCAVVLSTHPALAAASSGGGSLPWETPLTTFLNSMKGPVAYAISIVAIIATGVTLVWGGEVSEFTRRLIFIILVISLIALATSAYSSLFTNGAVFI